MAPIHPHWSSRTFLVYAAGLTALAALEGWFAYFGSRWTEGALVGAELVVLVVAALVAAGLRRAPRPVAAGVFAFVALVAFVAVLSGLWGWFGWISGVGSSGLRGFHVGRLALLLIWLVASFATLRAFRFPLIVVQAVGAGWIFVTDLLSNGGSWSAIVTLFVGLVYLALGVSVDAGPSRPYGFWLHVAAGVLIGGSLLWFWHGGDFEWTLIVVASLAYILFADVVGRSSWAVLGALGLLIASAHFSLEWTHIRIVFFNAGSGSSNPWAGPLVTTIAAFVLLALGLRASRTAAPSV